MLNIDPIVKVDVHIGTTTASSGVFDVGAILGSTVVSGKFDPDNRYKEYESLAAMVTDGFLTTSEEYKAAEKYFSVTPAPAKVVMVYYFANPAAMDYAAEYDTATTYNTGDYCKHTSGSVTNTYICNADSVTGAWDDTKWDEVTPGVTETPAEAMMDAIDRGAEFYAAYYIPRTGEANVGTNIAGMASAMESNNKGVVFYGYVNSVETAVGDSGLFKPLKDAGAKRAIGMFCTEEENDAAGLMGEAMGLSKANPESVFALCYKTVASATANNITQSEVAQIKAVNGNVYVQRTRDRAFIENGSAATGLRFDEILYIDRMAYGIQQAIYKIIADSSAKLPQNDSTSAMFLSAIYNVLEPYYNMGVLDTAEWRNDPIEGIIEVGDTVEHGHAEFVDTFDNQAIVDRLAHKAMPITVLLCLTGSVESIVINVDVQT